jgi:hypothetical protein
LAGPLKSGPFAWELDVEELLFAEEVLLVEPEDPVELVVEEPLLDEVEVVELPVVVEPDDPLDVLPVVVTIEVD